ncbi:MAG: BMP family ABC transporter substrate-binding protein [Oscillospiraceae bacterium]|nr:BMP family ABC transporter substrate-binding protein [Oscillospiraceae bacterium]
MAEYYYKEALKAGQKEYRACLSRGRSPLLPVMDDFVPDERSAAGSDLGIMSIPAVWIVGTKTRGRTRAFAPNYMPLLSEKTEFAVKWESLCQSHLAEGIRDPVKVYEYMNRYYVAEGNKRVSVLKYFGAAEITAEVIRVLPERSGEREVELYYELVEFQRLSHINFLEFSKKGGCAALQRMCGKGPEEEWTEEERGRFAAAYHYFRKAYLACGGDKLTTTPGDALLTYLEVYGYARLRASGEAELKTDIQKLWEEVELQQEELAIEVKTDPGQEKHGGLLSKVLPQTLPLRAAFLYDQPPEESGWTFVHEHGRSQAQRALGEAVETSAYFAEPGGDILPVIESAIEDGNTVVFTTSANMLQASLRAAVDHPETVIMNCSLNMPHRYIRSYYARMYEAKFIIGAVAASLSDTSDLGYICDYPVYGQIAGINGFALGAQMVNPKARVFLEWSSLRDGGPAERKLLDRGIDLISCQDSMGLSLGDHSSFGLLYIKEASRLLLAAPVWKWGVYYEGILRRMLNHTAQAEYESSSKALNYFWGMSAGVVDLYLSDKMPEGTKRLAHFLRDSITHGLCSPFLAPLYIQGHRSVGEGRHELSQEQIISMDYLVENIVGAIPRYEELNEAGRRMAEAAGVLREKNEGHV